MNERPCSPTRRILILGSTGSIGVGALEVVDHLEKSTEAGPRFEVVGLAAGTRGEALERQAARFDVDAVALADPAAAGRIHPDRRLHVGPDAALALVRETGRRGDLVIAAMVGAAGIPAVLAAIEIGCDIALANKETLVAAGSVVTTAAARHGVSILPIDSEHAAIHQCLRAGRSPSEVSKIVLTASGGPFRTWTTERIRKATVTEALAHPTWKMGRKVTIDSASMMNKGLELIEAHWLFQVDADRLDAIVHPQSIVHSFVEFTDGSSIGQLSPPDMRMPIQYAMCHPVRVAGCAPHLDFRALRELVFEPVDHERFPAVGLALAAIRAGGTSGAVLNAANETAVEAFLDDEIPFGRIPSLVESALARIEPVTADSLETVLDADHRARTFVHEQVRSPVAGS